MSGRETRSGYSRSAQSRKYSRAQGKAGHDRIRTIDCAIQGTGIHITVAKWLTPNGRWVNDTQGFDPDVKVDANQDDPTKDPQLDKALELSN